MGHLGQRVVLVHELGQLAGAEELFHGCRHGLGIDQVLGHQALALGHGESLLDRAFHPHQTNAELVLGHLTHRTNTPVAQVVDVVNHALAVANINQGLEYVDNVLAVQGAYALGRIAAETTVELHAAHAGQVVAIRREEQVLEQVFRRLLGGRLPRSHHAVNLNEGLQLITGWILGQGIGDEGPAVDLIGVDGLDVGDLLLTQGGEQFFGDLNVAIDQHLTGFSVDHVLGQPSAQQILIGHREVLHTGLIQLPDVTRRDATTALHQQFVIRHDVKGGHVALQPLWHQGHGGRVLLAQLERGGLVEHGEDFLAVITQRPHEYRRRQFAAPVNPREHLVFGVKLEVQPGATVGNDPG